MIQWWAEPDKHWTVIHARLTFGNLVFESRRLVRWEDIEDLAQPIPLFAAMTQVMQAEVMDALIMRGGWPGITKETEMPEGEISWWAEQEHGVLRGMTVIHAKMRMGKRIYEAAGGLDWDGVEEFPPDIFDEAISIMRQELVNAAMDDALNDMVFEAIDNTVWRLGYGDA